MQLGGVLTCNVKYQAVLDSIKDTLTLKFPFSVLNILGSNRELLHVTNLNSSKLLISGDLETKGSKSLSIFNGISIIFNGISI